MVGVRSRRANPRAAGLTLYELMIAVTILLVAILTTLRSQAISLDLVQTTAETDEATSDLQACMEQILLRSPDQIPIAGSQYAAGQPIAAYSDLHLSNERIVPTYPNYAGGAIVPDPLQIRLTLTWTDFKGRNRTLRMSTTRTR